MSALNDRQADFVHHLVTSGCTPTEAARAVGYSAPKQEAYRLTRLRHIQEAIRQERERLISAHAANVAVATLVEIMQDRQAPASARVGASRAIFEAAGLFDKNGRDTTSGKTLHEMSADDLAATIRQLDQEMERIAGSAVVN